MRRTLSLLAAATLLLASAASAQETFETPPAGNGSPLGTYNGFTWNNFYADNGCNLGGGIYGYCTGVISGVNMAYNAFAQDASITNGGIFDFGGAWFTAAFSSNPNVTSDPRFDAATGIAITGFLGGNAIYSTVFSIDFSTPRYFAANWTGIDQLYFSSRPNPGGSAHFVMDDISFQARSTVPEPASLALVAVGLAGLALARRRRTT